MANTMKAVVIHKAGGPEALKIESRSIPTAEKGQVLIAIKAFGLNRSELFTRQGLSGDAVVFPRILGIEGVGVVENAPGGEFKKGEVVATAMGGLGRVIEGSYAEYTVVPAHQAQTFNTDLPWDVRGALPEMLQTAWGSLFRSLQLKKGDRLLIRGGTSSVGFAAAAIAKNHGAFVASTTRQSGRSNLLKSAGADQVFVDDGAIAKDVEKGQKFDKVLELVGTTTLLDSLQCVNENGIVCMTGMVGNSWLLPQFSPMGAIPTTVCLTTYSGGNEDFQATPLDELARLIADGKMKIPIGKIFRLDEIVEAHRCMEDNKAGGKIVVLV